MAFTDLPDDFSSRPLTGAQFVADVLDLVVSEADRRRGALALLLCDDDDRLLAPVVVGELDEQPADRERALRTVFSAVAGTASVVLAVARADGLGLRPDDHAWAAAAARACADGPRLLGVHVITVDGSREVPFRAAA